MHVADVVERELAVRGDDSEISKKVAAARPQPPLERALHLEPGAYDFEKFTFGTCVAAGGASKNG